MQRAQCAYLFKDLTPLSRRSVLVDTVLNHPPIVSGSFETRGGESTLYSQQQSPLQQPAASQPRTPATLTSPPAAQRHQELLVEVPQAPAADVVQMQRELEQLRTMVRDQRAGREAAMQQASKAEQQAAQVAEIAMMACKDIDESLQRMASLQMTAQRVHSQTLGPAVQIRIPVYQHCLKELDSSRNKVQMLRQTCTAITQR